MSLVTTTFNLYNYQMKFHDFHDSRIDLQYFYDFDYSHIDFYDFHYFNDSDSIFFDFNESCRRAILCPLIKLYHLWTYVNCSI